MTASATRCWLNELVTASETQDPLAGDPSEDQAPQTAQTDDAALPVRHVNTWHEDLAEWGFPVGTESDDGVATVGHNGWLFLKGGTNRNLPQFTGEVPMAPGWLEDWCQMFQSRVFEAQAQERLLGCLVVPEKLGIYEDQYPEPLERVAQRPIERLLEAQLDLIYPFEELKKASEHRDVFLRTDTHLSLYGNYVLNAVLLEKLGVQPLSDELLRHPSKQAFSGDLGSRFEPAIVEVQEVIGSFGNARVVADNWEAIVAAGGHVGTQRVLSNDTAADPRTVVLFGDSFGFNAEIFHGTSWFLAQVFRTVHFLWAPFGWDPGYVEKVGADIVLCQMAERFVGRVPAQTVDVEALAADTLGRQAGVDFEVLFRSLDR